jgi:SAM-dependent methyltransferase
MPGAAAATGSPPPCPVCADRSVGLLQSVDGRDYWRCRCCQATFLDPDQLPLAADEHAQYRLHRNAVDDPGYRSFLDRLVQPLLGRLAPASAGLDFGCGPGPALASMLAGHGHAVALYDPLFRPDAKALQREYDFVTCTEVIEHLHRPAQVFARLWTLVRPGGWLALMTAFQDDAQDFARWHYRRDPTHVVFYRRRTIEVLAASVGWSCRFPAEGVALLQRPATGGAG